MVIGCQQKTTFTLAAVVFVPQQKVATIAAGGLHVLYNFYSSATFALVSARFALTSWGSPRLGGAGFRGRTRSKFRFF